MINTSIIIDKIKEKGTIRTNDLVDIFGVSRQYIAKLLSRLIIEKKIIRIGSTRYSIYTTEDYLQKNPQLTPLVYSKTLINNNLEEHKVFNEIEHNFPTLQKLSENIKSIFEYAFSEMLNNAIEHSLSNKIKITIRLNEQDLSFIVDDFGIGVFKNIMKKRGLTSELEAVQDLLKGKTTTAPKLHSGEGIFFTSKVGDEFILDSYGCEFIANNKINDIFVKKVKGQKQGTRVTFRININNQHHLNDVFKEYTNSENSGDYGFDKTEIKVKLYILGGVYISRSQARRILSGLEKFKAIVMDYDRVPTVGQAFADEIYRVFILKNPGIKIQDENMNETVKFMIDRARNEAKIER